MNVHQYIACMVPDSDVRVDRNMVEELINGDGACCGQIYPSVGRRVSHIALV